MVEKARLPWLGVRFLAGGESGPKPCHLLTQRLHPRAREARRALLLLYIHNPITPAHAMPRVQTFKALYAFQADEADELELVAGDLIDVTVVHAGMPLHDDIPTWPTLFLYGVVCLSVI